MQLNSKTLLFKNIHISIRAHERNLEKFKNTHNTQILIVLTHGILSVFKNQRVGKGKYRIEMSLKHRKLLKWNLTSHSPSWYDQQTFCGGEHTEQDAGGHPHLEFCRSTLASV